MKTATVTVRCAIRAFVCVAILSPLTAVRAELPLVECCDSSDTVCDTQLWCDHGYESRFRLAEINIYQPGQRPVDRRTRRPLQHRDRASDGGVLPLAIVEVCGRLAAQPQTRQPAIRQAVYHLRVDGVLAPGLHPAGHEPFLGGAQRQRLDRADRRWCPAFVSHRPSEDGLPGPIIRLRRPQTIRSRVGIPYDRRVPFRLNSEVLRRQACEHVSNKASGEC